MRLSTFGKSHYQTQKTKANKLREKKEKEEAEALKNMQIKLVEVYPDIDQLIKKCYSVVENDSSRADLILSSTRRMLENNAEFEELHQFLLEQEEILFSRNKVNDFKNKEKFSTVANSEVDSDDESPSDEGLVRKIRVSRCFKIKNKFRMS